MIRDEGMAGLLEHARIPIAFTATDRWTRDGGTEPITPFLKDYDALEPPSSWPTTFDTRRWGLISAWRDDRRVGGAVLAFDTPGLDMLEGRRDRVAVWDLRVSPSDRGSGIGTSLFEAALAWSAARGCRDLVVETQDINVPACRFDQRMGCRLVSWKAGFYAACPEEAQLVFGRAVGG